MRFWLRMVSELKVFEADGLYAVPHEEQAIQLQVKRREYFLKKINVKKELVAQLVGFLYSRVSVVLADLSGASGLLKSDEQEFEFVTAISANKNVLIARVSVNIAERTFHMTNFRWLETDRALEVCGLSDFYRTVFLNIISVSCREERPVIIAAPSEEHLLLLGALVRTFVNSEKLNIEVTAPAIVKITEDDSIRALGRFITDSEPHGAKPAGVICGMFLEAAASGTKLSFKLTDLEKLPVALSDKLIGAESSNTLIAKEPVGAGSYTGIFSLIPPGEMLDLIFDDRASLENMAAMLYPLGTRALVEDGIEKILLGRVNPHDVFDLLPELPEYYLKYCGRHKALEATGGAFSDKDLAAAITAEEMEADSEEEQAGDSRRILVVEDDKDQRQILEMVLKAAGYEVTLAEDGERGLELLNKHGADLVITDLMMPGMDGAELIKSLRSSDKFKRLPILVLTVVSDDEREYELLELGADDFCNKRIQRRLLLTRISKLLDRPRA
ncbi:MAG: response regulator [Candidatus Dadabacteria bacterium]|nr:MAG: response regulator [Candidatus Dadabacteria bacterium]